MKREYEAVHSSFWLYYLEVSIFIETWVISILHFLQNPVFKVVLCPSETKYFLSSGK